MVLNQASLNQQAHESAQPTVPSASTGVMEESGDSTSAAQDSDSEPQSDLGTDVHCKKWKHHCHKVKKLKKH